MFFEPLHSLRPGYQWLSTSVALSFIRSPGTQYVIVHSGFSCKLLLILLPLVRSPEGTMPCRIRFLGKTNVFDDEATPDCGRYRTSLEDELEACHSMGPVPTFTSLEEKPWHPNTTWPDVSPTALPCFLPTHALG